MVAILLYTIFFLSLGYAFVPKPKDQSQSSCSANCGCKPELQ